MGKYKKIAVIYGSDSSEWEVSCRSGEFVASRIDGTQYDVYEILARFRVPAPRLTRLIFRSRFTARRSSSTMPT